MWCLEWDIFLNCKFYCSWTFIVECCSEKNYNFRDLDITSKHLKVYLWNIFYKHVYKSLQNLVEFAQKSDEDTKKIQNTKINNNNNNNNVDLT